MPDLLNHLPNQRNRIVLALAGLSALMHVPLVAALAEGWRGTSVEQLMVPVLVPFISAGLFYLRRDEFLARPPAAFGLILQGTSIVAAAIVLSSGASELLTVTLAMSIAAFVFSRYGLRGVKAGLAPTLMLPLLIPFGGQLGDEAGLLLRESSAHLATLSLNVLSFPAIQSDTTIHLGGTLNRVTEACSGTATFTALVVYALAYAQAFRLNVPSMLTIVGAMVPLSLLANGVRIAFLSLVLLYRGEATASGPVHDLSAVIVFAGVYALVAVAARLVQVDQQSLTLQQVGES